LPEKALRFSPLSRVHKEVGREDIDDPSGRLAANVDQVGSDRDHLGGLDKETPGGHIDNVASRSARHSESYLPGEPGLRID
jgi:hypothetical protein